MPLLLTPCKGDLVKEKTEKKIRFWCRIFLGVYLVLLVYFLIFSEEWGRTFLEGEYRYNLFHFRKSADIFGIGNRSVLVCIFESGWKCHWIYSLWRIAAVDWPETVRILENDIYWI